MKRLFAIAALLLGLLGVQAQTPEDQYIYIYNVIQDADNLVRNQQNAGALSRYREAYASLLSFQKGYPDWNSAVVKFRLAFLVKRITELSASVPPEAEAAAAAKPQAAAPPAAEDLRNQLTVLQNQVRQLQGDKSLLEAKLKEALSLRPAATDPEDLARAQERIKSLSKENELLNVSLEQLKAEAKTPGARPDPALAEANQRLQAEHEKLQSRVSALMTEAEAAQALRAENELLKKQLAAKGKADPVVSSPSQAQIAALQSEKEILRLEKVALESTVKQLMTKAGSAGAVPAAAPAGSDRTRELEEEIASLRLRLQVLEASKVPYTPEELALFKKPAATLTVAKSSDPAAKAPTVNVTLLAAEAERHFAAREYDKAEDSYRQLLQQDNTNVVMLGNLAIIQMEQGKAAEAEATLERALEIAPRDVYSLSTLGMLMFRQKKYDQAVEALSRAAELQPNNPEVQNRLGLALSDKGLRGPAETAFRKAIQIKPGYGEAHYNLAVEYVTQKPPLVELARWHYQKGLDNGEPKNAKLEALLEAAGK